LGAVGEEAGATIAGGDLDIIGIERCKLKLLRAGLFGSVADGGQRMGEDGTPVGFRILRRVG